MSNYKIQNQNYKDLGKNIKIAFVVSEFNGKYTKQLEDINEDFLRKEGFENIKKFLVPGALEIPAFVKLISKKWKPDLIICLGVVIRGETTHYEIVSNESAKAIMNLSLKLTEETAIINGILTCENEKQVKERISDTYAISGLNLLLERKKV